MGTAGRLQVVSGRGGPGVRRRPQGTLQQSPASLVHSPPSAWAFFGWCAFSVRLVWCFAAALCAVGCPADMAASTSSAITTLRLKYETKVGLDKDFLNKKKGESRLVMREGVAPVPEVCTWKAPVLHSMNHRNRRRYPLLRAHQALQRAAHSLTELLERIYEQSQLGQNGSILRQHRLGVLTHEPAKSSQHHCA